MEHTGFESGDIYEPIEQYNNVILGNNTPLGSYNNVYEPLGFYDNVFEPHEDGFKHHGSSTTTEEHTQHLLQHISDNTHDFINQHIGLQTTKKLVDLGAVTEQINDDPIMNRYAELANESYNHYENKPKTTTEFEKVEHLNTNKNNVIMENENEVHMSVRGSMETKDWTDNNAKILSRVFGKMENTDRYIEAEEQLLRANRYAQLVGKKLTISGHSLGGYLSYDLANKHDIEGYHFDPGISLKQVYQQLNRTFRNNVNVQKIFKTHFDLPSLRITQFHSIFNNSTDTKVHYIGTKPSLDNTLVKTHSVEHFMENASKVRNTSLSSIVKSLSLAGAVGIQGFSAYQDIKRDQNTHNKLTNSSIDGIKNISELAGGLGIGVALGPELLVPALLSGALFNIGAKHLAEELKTTGVQDANVIKKAFVDGKDIHGKNIGKRIKSEFKEDVIKPWAKTGKSIKHFFGRIF